MCCLFGLLDYGGSLTTRQKNKILSILSEECEARGTDAAGFAYNSSGVMHIYKKPGPAHKIKWHVPSDVYRVMGHTRMTTQGSEKKNYNNHPFSGQAGRIKFALAHNGVISNDKLIRRTEKLPYTKIETDSYIAIQLLEKQNSVSLDSIKHMAEQVEGTFCFTVLDEFDNWYLIKGDNPMCLCRFPRTGIYLYASTEVILEKSLYRISVKLGKAEQINTRCGEILRVDKFGQIVRSEFDMKERQFEWRGFTCSIQSEASDQAYISELKSVAAAFGFTPAYIDELIGQGFCCEDIEDILYDGQLFVY